MTAEYYLIRFTTPHLENHHAWFRGGGKKKGLTILQNGLIVANL